MAVVRAFKKEYHVDNASETTGYDELVADMETWYDWDEIDTSDEASTLFKKFQPDSSEKWVGIKVLKSTSTYGMKVMAYSCNGTTTYWSSQLYISNNQQLRYAAVTLTDKGFFLMGGNSTFPYTTGYASLFGMSACTNKITGENGICAVAIQTTTGVAVMSGSTNNGSFLNFASPTDGRGCDFVLHAPLASPYSQDVPNDVLRLVIRPDTKIACLENVTMDGKNYVRLGDLLIPE